MEKRESLSNLAIKPDRFFGILLLTAGLGTMLIGRAGSQSVLQLMSILATIPGIILLLLGREYLKALWVPVAYLSLMMPVWAFLFDGLHLPMQKATAVSAEFILNSLGIPVYRNGLMLELPHQVLEVARECSGVNYIIGVVAIGILVGYLLYDKIYRKSLLILLAVLVALLSNFLRVALIGICLHLGINGVGVHGPYHVFMGMFVMVFGFLALGAGTLLIKRDKPPQTREFKQEHVLNQFKWDAVSVVLILVLILAGIYVNFGKHRAVPLGDRKPFPYTVGNWFGVDSKDDAKLGADFVVSRRYRNDSGKEIRLSLHYFSYQEQDRKLKTNDKSSLANNALDFTVLVDGIKPVKVVRGKEYGKKETIFTTYLYGLDDRLVSDIWTARGLTIWNELIHNRTNAFLIIITSGLEHCRDEEDALQTLSSFIGTVYPQLQEFTTNSSLFSAPSASLR